MSPRRQPLERAQVLAAAVALAREEGVGALTMRRLSDRLGAWPTSVYHHLGGAKADLVALTVDALAEEVDLGDSSSAAWDRQLRALAHEVRRVALSVPGLAEHLLIATAPGPNAVAIFQRVVGLLRAGGLSEREAYSGYRVMMAFVLGQTRADGGDGDADRLAALRAASGDGPTAAVLEAASALTVEERFELGLDLLLDGLRRASA